jgi:hypothetical protein
MGELDNDKPFAEEGYALMAAAFEMHAWPWLVLVFPTSWKSNLEH